MMSQVNQLNNSASETIGLGEQLKEGKAHFGVNFDAPEKRTLEANQIGDNTPT
jgi:hypothetical protein